MEKIQQTKLSERIFHKKLKSGLDIFLMKKEGISKKYAIFSTDYGANDLEYINPHTKKHIKLNEGIAHFLEHKMFEMPDGSNAFDEFAKYGASANASTGFNITNYLFSSTEVENFEGALKHLIRYVQTPHFTDENVEKEKGIIAQEIKMYDDVPGWQLFFGCLKAMYKTHPNSIDIAGDVDSIYKITPEELYDCYCSFYSPSNMAIFVVGDIDADKILNIIEESVTDKNSFEGEIKRLSPSETDPIREKFVSKKMQVSMPMVMIGYKEKNASLKYGKESLKKQVAISIAQDIMFSKSSDFYGKIFESGLIVGDLSTEYNRQKDYGYAIISGNTPNPDQLRKEIFAEISRRKNEGISEEEFSRVKKQTLGSYISNFDHIEAVAGVYLEMHFDGYSLLDQYEIIENIKIEDVAEAFKDIFDDEMCSVSEILPAN